MTVFRIKKTENYITLHKGALENPCLSFKAKGFWAYCMSRPNDWQFHLSHLIKVSKENKAAIYSAIKELEGEGYIKKIQKHENGRFQKVDYEIYETPELKKCLLLTDFQQAEIQHTENQPLLSNDNTKSSSSLRSEESKIHNKAPASPPPSADAEYLVNFFLEKIKERRSSFKHPDLKKWTAEMDRLIRIDKREVDEVKRLIEWSALHQYWKGACISPEKLRKSYDEMCIQMQAGSEKARIQHNRSWALRQKEAHPQELRSLSFDDKFARNLSAGKEVPFHLPHENFKRVFASMFGGEINE